MVVAKPMFYTIIYYVQKTAAIRYHPMKEACSCHQSSLFSSMTGLMMTLHSAVKVVYGGRHLKRTRERFVVFDSKLFMASHITKICASSFYYIYNVRWIRKYLSRQSSEILVHAFITSCLDYCNGLLYGLPDCLLNKLQRVQNACARLIFREQKFCPVTPLIYKLH